MPETNFENAKIPEIQGIEAIAIPRKVDIIVGDTATYVKKPKDKQILAVKVVQGSFLVETGKNDGLSSAPAFPTQPTTTTINAAGVGDGSASWVIDTTDKFVPISAPNGLTFKGADGSSKMYLIWM